MCPPVPCCKCAVKAAPPWRGARLRRRRQVLYDADEVALPLVCVFHLARVVHRGHPTHVVRQLKSIKLTFIEKVWRFQMRDKIFAHEAEVLAPSGLRRHARCVQHARCIEKRQRQLTLVC